MVATVMNSSHEERAGSCCQGSTSPTWDPTKELCCIMTTFQHLHTSGWYWGSLSASEARELLLKESVGTFLVRDSSHPRYMLTLSVKTRCGPTNVRIEYNRGCFRLDSSPPGLPQLQSFPDVLSLVQHYISPARTPRDQGDDKDKDDILPSVEPNPAQPSSKDGGVCLKLIHPLHRPHSFPSLQHITRLAINRYTDSHDQLPLPRCLVCYLQDYPFKV